MQNTLLMKGDADSLISNQINALELARTALQEAERERDAALDERIKALEEKIQLVIQQNSSLSADLDQARALYQDKLVSNASELTSSKKEIAELQSQVDPLNSNIASLQQESSTLLEGIRANQTEKARLIYFWQNVKVCVIS